MAANADTATTTGFEARRRSSIFHQAIRFAVLNLKILKLTRHHG